MSDSITVVRRCFELVEGIHNKFWTIEIVGNEYHATYGRIGSDGATQVKTFRSVHACEAEALKKIREKVNKGYREVNPQAHPGSKTLQNRIRQEPQISAPRPRASVSSRSGSPGEEEGRFLDI
jgi:predicted DNA-binding WGR domain protein